MLQMRRRIPMRYQMNVQQICCLKAESTKLILHKRLVKWFLISLDRRDKIAQILVVICWMKRMKKVKVIVRQTSTNLILKKKIIFCRKGIIKSLQEKTRGKLRICFLISSLQKSIHLFQFKNLKGELGQFKKNERFLG